MGQGVSDSPQNKILSNSIGSFYKFIVNLINHLHEALIEEQLGSAERECVCCGLAIDRQCRTGSCISDNLVL